MKNKVLIGVGVFAAVSVLFLVIILSVSSAKREKLVPKSNLKELTTLEHVKSFKEEIKTSANSVTSVAGQEQAAPVADSYSISVDVDGNKATVTNAAGQSQDLTIDQYKAQFSPVNDYSVWEKAINEGKYEISDSTFEGNDVWKYVIKEQSITNDYLKTLSPTLLAQTGGQFAAQGMEVKSSTLKFEGILEFEILIGKSDYEIKYATVKATKPIEILMVVSIGGQELPSSVTMTDFTISFAVRDYELKGLAAKLPRMPLFLWVGSMM